MNCIMSEDTPAVPKPKDTLLLSDIRALVYVTSTWRKNHPEMCEKGSDPTCGIHFQNSELPFS